MRKLLVFAFVWAACGGPQERAAPPSPSTSTGSGTAPAPAPVAASPAVVIPAHPWPATEAHAVTEILHGKTISDPYRWLEDDTAPATQAWMTAQDSYARAELARSPARAAYAERLKQLFYFDAISAPVDRGGRLFYTRKLTDKEKWIMCWKQGEAGREQVLFDPNQWSADGSTGLGSWSVSWDGKRVAYGIKEHNSDEEVMHVRDVASGKDLPDILPGTKYSSASWTPDGRGFYYTWVPPVGDKLTVADRPGFAELRFHKLGTPPAHDPVVYPATGSAEAFLHGDISRDGHWLIAEVEHGENSTDVYLKDLRRKPAEQSAWITLVAGADATFDVRIWRDRFYLRTNQGAARYRIYKVDPELLDRASWREIVKQNDDTLEQATIVGEHLVLSYLRNAASAMEIRDLEGKPVRQVDLPLGSSWMAGNPDGDVGYIGFTAFTAPYVIYKTSIKTGKTTEWERIKLPVDTTQLISEQVFYPSKDGTKISMFLLYKKGTQRDGNNPVILYGYGGFTVSLTPGFSSSRMAWLERGGMYAIPNLRGGGEYGEDWHKAGMLLHKQNGFDDFIAAAEYLIAERWTSSQHLAISGASNGGLLVGATVVQRPDLFKAVDCGVPLLDMLRYHLFGSGKTWVPEYGSVDDAAQFAALYAYSPYRLAIDHGPTAYPAVLFESADHDDRVDPMHARKLAAALQSLQTGSGEILLRIERNAGHGGADLVKQQVERTADALAWLEQELK